MVPGLFDLIWRPCTGGGGIQVLDVFVARDSFLAKAPWTTFYELGIFYVLV